MKKPPCGSPADPKAARLAEALRANLLKRKAQMRGSAAPPPDLEGTAADRSGDDS